MFNINKPAFSNATNNNSTFFGTTQSRFGDSSFCKPTPSFGEQAFGKPATPNFGASTTGTASNTFGGSSMFGTTSNPFAQPPSAQSSNVFGSTLFRNTNQNDMFSVSQKPGSFNFTSPQTSAGIFGQPVSPISSQNQNNLFNQPSNVFTSSPTFGSGQTITGTVIKFAAVNVADTAMIKGINQTINCRHQSITCMKEYEDKSFEELRWEDYHSNRKGPQNDYFGNQPNTFGGEPMSMESAANMFPNSNKSYFGASTFGHNKFGTTASHSSGNPSGLFNKSIAGFTTTPSNPTPFNFNLNQTTTSSFFGNTSTNTPANNFGMQQQQQQQSNLFNTNQQSNFGTFNQNASSNLFSKNVNSFTATTATNSFLGMQQNPQQNSLFPGLNSTNTTFSHGNLPVTTTPTIGQSSFGQNNLFQSSLNKTNTDETPSNENNDEDNNTNSSYGEVNSQSSNESLNPAGITLTRAEYYTVPPLNEIGQYVSEDGTCIIQGFTIGRIGYGSVFFPDAFDVSNLNLDELVHFRHKEINIYPNESEKPSFGEGLNRKAQITLDNVWPFDKKTKRIIKDIETLTKINYTGRLRRLCEKQHTKFIEYRPDTGSWVFKVEHFSKYGDRDDETDLDDFIPPQNTLSTNLNIITDSNKIVETPATNDTNTFGLNIITTDFSKCSLMKSTFFDENDIDNLKNNNSEESLDEELNKLANSISKKLSETDITEQEVPFGDKELPLDIFEDNSGEYVNTADCVELPPGKIPYNRTFFSYFRMLADLSGFKGRCFKVGWAKNLTFVNLTPNDNQIKTYRDHYPSATVLININRVNTISNTEIFNNCFEKHLNCELETSQFEIRENIPYFKPKLNFDLLKKQTETCSSYSFEQQIWQLCTTLWMEIPTLDLEKYDLRTIRKSLFSNWLKTVISAECSARKTTGLNEIFNCLTENRIDEACEIALKSDNNNLAVIISQLPSNMILRALFKRQIKQWLDCDIIPFINPIILKLYCLAAGLTKIELKDNLIMCVYENMNWIKTLAIYFWFIIKPNEPLTYAVNTYEKQLKNNNNISKPYPKYGNTFKIIYDLRFQILKFYSDNRFSLSNVLNPTSYTDNILDYRFSWFLLQTFRSLEYASISPKIRLFVTINFAAQLEAMGLWHWAVYIISTIEEIYLKKMLIKELIGRNVESLKNCTEIYKMKELFLVNTLKIPTDWIEHAKAILTLDQGNFQEAICYLCYSNKWHEAYKILLNILLPYNFLCYDYQFLTKILTPFANHKLLFPNWENEGGLMLDFAELGIDFNNLKSIDSVRIQSESIRFRTTVININSRLKDINDFNYIRIIARRNVSILEKLLNC